MQINGDILEKFFLLFDKKISENEKNFMLGKSSPDSLGSGLKLNNISQKFLEKFFKYKKIFSICPFVKGIFIGNTVAFGSANKDSDIDLFIVFENGRIWIGRIFLTIIIHLFGIRRHGKKIAGRFCLSFFASEKGAFELENIQIEKNNQKNIDIYLAIWTATLIPVFGDEKFFEEFYEKNKWMENYGIKFLNEKNFPKNKKNFLKNFLEKILNFNFLENFIKKIFKKRSIKKKNLLNKKNNYSKNFGIIISDNYLKFHDNDIRLEIMEKLYK